MPPEVDVNINPFSAGLKELREVWTAILTLGSPNRGRAADLAAVARQQAGDGLGELAGRNAITAKVHASYTAFRERSAPWSRVSIEAVLRARG